MPGDFHTYLLSLDVTVSSFRGIAKHFEFLTQLSNVNYSSFNLHIVESFVCRFFDRKSDICDINQPRAEMFKSGLSLDKLPPIKAALEQHAKRAMLQVHAWQCALEQHPLELKPEDWGWHQPLGKLVPLWSLLPSVSEILVHFTTV